MKRKILVLGFDDHGKTDISQRVIEAITEEKEAKLIEPQEIKDGQTNRRERRKQKRSR